MQSAFVAKLKMGDALMSLSNFCFLSSASLLTFLGFGLGAALLTPALGPLDVERSRLRVCRFATMGSKDSPRAFLAVSPSILPLPVVLVLARVISAPKFRRLLLPPRSNLIFQACIVRKHVYTYFHTVK